MLFARFVPFKGADTEWVTKRTIRDLGLFGHRGKVILRSDQEPALVKLLEDIAQMSDSQDTMIENSAVGDSRGTGFIERGVRRRRNVQDPKT